MQQIANPLGLFTSTVYKRVRAHEDAMWRVTQYCALVERILAHVL